MRLFDQGFGSLAQDPHLVLQDLQETAGRLLRDGGSHGTRIRRDVLLVVLGADRHGTRQVRRQAARTAVHRIAAGGSGRLWKAGRGAEVLTEGRDVVDQWGQFRLKGDQSSAAVAGRLARGGHLRVEDRNLLLRVQQSFLESNQVRLQVRGWVG